MQRSRGLEAGGTFEMLGRDTAAALLLPVAADRHTRSLDQRHQQAIAAGFSHTERRHFVRVSRDWCISHMYYIATASYRSLHPCFWTIILPLSDPFPRAMLPGPRVWFRGRGAVRG
eukprot:6200258-Pleurochrysis_carterae.AAC.2